MERISQWSEESRGDRKNVNKSKELRKGRIFVGNRDRVVRFIIDTPENQVRLNFRETSM